MLCKHVDMILKLLLVRQRDKKQNGKKKKKTFLCFCSTSQAHTSLCIHIICQLLCSSDRYHGNEFNISLLLLAYAYCSGLAYLCLRNTFLCGARRKTEKHKCTGLRTVIWVVDASKRSTYNMQDLCWGFAKSKPSFSSPF